MRKVMLAAVASLALLFLAGCLSTGFLGFLATTEQVKKELEDRDRQIAAMKDELEGYRSLKADAQEAVRQVAETRSVIEELQALAKRAEERILALPTETIRRIVEILQASLQ